MTEVITSAPAPNPKPDTCPNPRPRPNPNPNPDPDPNPSPNPNPNPEQVLCTISESAMLQLHAVYPTVYKTGLVEAVGVSK
jgi:hypothetical protein